MLHNLLAAYSYTYDTTTSASSGSILGGALFWIVLLGASLVAIVGMWKAFQKAGRPGWASIVPIYNEWVLFEIAGKPGWWALLSLVPFVNLIVFILLIIAYIEVSKRFGKSGAFSLLLIFFPFIGWPMLGFGDAKYMEEAEEGDAVAAPYPASFSPKPASSEPTETPAPDAAPDNTSDSNDSNESSTPTTPTNPGA